jgi:bacterioferritin (cytochrome b1)
VRLLLAVISIMLMLQGDPKPKSAIRIVTIELQREILKEQLAQSNIQRDSQPCNVQMDKWSKDFTSHQMVINTLIDKAYKAANLDKDKWTLSLDTFEFSEKPLAPVPATSATPEGAKSDAKKP